MIAKWFKKNERRLSTLAFLTGFTIDNFTLTRIDLLFDNLILGSYLFIAATSIFLFQLFDKNEIKGWFSRHAVLFLPLFMQFAFGGLFSGYFVFYSRSASFSTTLVFVGLLVTLLIANEFFKKHYSRLTFQLSILFVALFSFAIFYVPILTKSINVFTFLLSGAASLIIIRLFIGFLKFFIFNKIEASKKNLVISILSIYVIFNTLYFTNFIPPIPLSHKEAGIYYQVTRSGETYTALTEDRKWYELFNRTVLYRTLGEPVSYFSAVFAPTDLNTKVFHSWQYYDEPTDSWIETDRLEYNIVGGRDGGYRGFSTKSNVFSGRWRVDVVTTRNQIVGRTTFIIDNSQRTPDLVQISL